MQNSARVAKIGPNGERIIQSFSGHERNHLFLNVDGKRFDDISALSGLDTEADSRAFALWDFDHDGWQDVALVNANRPLMNLYHNEVSQLARDRHSLSIRLVGGNKSSHPSTQWSTRDGYGASVTAVCGDKLFVREHRCGEGFAAQNSNTLLIGTGTARKVDRVEVRWPSGQTQTISNLDTGQLLTIYENPEDSGIENQPFLVQTRVAADLPSEPADKYASLSINLTEGVVDPPDEDKYRVYVTTATWCAACTQNLPQVAMLSELFNDKIEIYGIPVDPKDNATKLNAYADKNKPAYEIVTKLSSKDKQAVSNMVRTLLGSDALPATIVTDPTGRYLGSARGVPSTSWFAELLRERP